MQRFPIHPELIPVAKAAFKPRADAGLLSQLAQNAWVDFHEAQFPAAETAAVGEAVARHVESLYPAGDMPTLARYGVARKVSAVNVRIHNGRDWSEVAGIELGREILIPDSYGSRDYYCGGPRFSRDPLRGLTPQYRATLSDADFAKLCADQDSAERGAIPEELEPFFAKVLNVRNLFRAEYKQATDWPAEFKAEQGRYPTWGEIADRFPVLGDYLQGLWAARLAA